jgi:EAL domain-containing protein (putative c-di-GMP-specific phosphodiesterase class I)
MERMIPNPDPAFADLLEFIYLMPVGVVKFSDDGTIDMMNPMATQLLMPLVGAAASTNLFDTLRVLCPLLADKVAAFRAETGTIIDQERIEGRAGQKTVTLSLSVTRVRRNIHMAVVKDVSRLTDMVAYAFAAADLLVDVDADGVIGWIGGAFKMLPDLKPRDLVGKTIAELFAPRDRASLTRALLVIAARGRLPPLLLRLAHGHGARCVVAGLTLGGAHKRFMVTIGPPPLARLADEPSVQTAGVFGKEAEAWLRHGEAGRLGLVDIMGWENTAARLNAARLSQLKTDIAQLVEGDTLGETSEALVMGELSGGRYGVLGGGEAELARLGSALHDLVGQAAPEARLQVQTASVDLAPGGLSVAQSVQALRVALSRFGTEGAQAPGLAGGLVGIIERATSQKRALAACIAKGGFDLAYQPIVSLHGGEVHHYEALLRPRLESGLAASSPAEFVALAEAVGLSETLDLAVLRRTMAALRQSRVVIAVNVSGDSIAQPDFVRQVLVLAAGVGTGRLMIELTETSEIQDLPAAAAQIQLLRAAKLQVCLDDFGAGSASFRYMRDLQCDFVKIDGAYCHAARRTEQGKSIVRAMCDLAASAGAQTIAEMIETEADVDLMREVGVGFGQGWLFGKPGALPQTVEAAPEKARRWRY